LPLFPSPGVYACGYERNNTPFYLQVPSGADLTKYRLLKEAETKRGKVVVGFRDPDVNVWAREKAGNGAFSPSPSKKI
jgi:hypothetical protein